MAYKSSVEEKSPVDREINIEIPRAEYQEEFDKLLRKAASQANVKGFRPGRAPRAVVAKMFGEKIHGDVMSRLVSDAYREALEEHDLKVVGYPEIDIDDKDAEKDLKVTASVSVFPEPSIEKVDGLSIEVETSVFSEEEFEKRLNGLAEQFSEIKPIEERTSAEAGDLAMVDFSGTVDGEPFPGSSGEGVYVEIGSGRSLKEIEEALPGMEVGAEQELQAVLPDDGPEELAGKEAQYSLSLKGLYQKHMPELDDELAKKTGLAEDLEGLKRYVRSELEREVARKNEVEREEKLLRAVLEKNPFEVPEALVDEEVRNVLFEMGFLNPQDERSYQIDVSRFRENLGEPAEFRVRRSIILEQLRKKEDLSFEDEEVGSWLDGIAERDGKSREEVDKLYGFPGSMAQLKNMMANEKIIEKLLGAAKIKEITE